MAIVLSPLVVMTLILQVLSKQHIPDPRTGNQVTGSIRSAYEALTGDTSMQVGNYIKTVSKHGAVAVGVQAQASDLGAALGAKSSALNTASTALGVGAVANKDNAVALGAASMTSTDATGESSATINGVTYGGFAGGNNIVAGDQVSVGNVGFERQIKHVAPGAVTAASTDAINGSQLYSVASGLQTQIANISSSGSNVHFYHVNGCIYRQQLQQRRRDRREGDGRRHQCQSQGRKLDCHR